MNETFTMRTWERSDALFHDALQDPSNLEMDWLWLAGQVTRLYEQHYCLMQALRINPQSTLARQRLAQLRLIAERPIEPCLGAR